MLAVTIRGTVSTKANRGPVMDSPGARLSTCPFSALQGGPDSSRAMAGGA